MPLARDGAEAAEETERREELLWREQEAVMWRRKLRTIFGLLAVCIVWLSLPPTSSAGEAPPESKHFLWQVDSPTGRAYLLGSIHVLDQRVYPLAPVIEEAFAASHVLVLEADVFDTPREELVQSVMAYATYEPGQTLKNQLSESDYVALTGALLEAGIPIDSVQQYRPWFVSLMVDQALESRLGLRPEYGLDAYFQSKASGQKAIEELESVEAQVQMLAGFSDQEQVLMMSSAMEDLEHAAEEFDEMVQIWQRGDIRAMEEQQRKEIQEDPGFEPIWKVMIDERNLVMADRIVTFMETNKRYFIVVGAAHLVGPQGLVALLRQRGYTVQQL